MCLRSYAPTGKELFRFTFNDLKGQSLYRQHRFDFNDTKGYCNVLAINITRRTCVPLKYVTFFLDTRLNSDFLGQTFVDKSKRNAKSFTEFNLGYFEIELGSILTIRNTLFSYGRFFSTKCQTIILISHKGTFPLLHFYVCLWGVDVACFKWS